MPSAQNILALSGALALAFGAFSCGTTSNPPPLGPDGSGSSAVDAGDGAGATTDGGATLADESSALDGGGGASATTDSGATLPHADSTPINAPTAPRPQTER